jgi:hypothetical protein
MKVVFDTNAYLDLTRELDCSSVRDLACDLRSREAAKGYEGLASPNVMWELLAHLCDPSDPSRDASVRAVTLLAVHCRVRGGYGGLNVAAPFEGEICRLLFNREIAGLEDLVLGFGEVCDHVADLYMATASESTAASACVTNSAETLATRLAHGENQFKDMFKSDVLTVDPTGGGTRITKHAPYEVSDILKDIRSESMLPNLALKFVMGMAQTLGEQLTDEQARRYATQMAQLFPVPLEIFRELWEQVAMNEFDIDHPKKQRGNFHWDISIAAIASGTICGQPVLLVTSDQAMIRACGRAGYGDSVLETAAYRDLICL